MICLDEMKAQALSISLWSLGLLGELPMGTSGPLGSRIKSRV